MPASDLCDESKLKSKKPNGTKKRLGFEHGPSLNLEYLVELFHIQQFTE